ncbi:hypothetical protein FBY31_3246 [Arthrobacter sp. SLBN-100]|uniref:hypothetical protein n=1 Tax=Arthrobacter sp. SLBN-100 TaxID=2768450 RepID=UPI001152421B|nr:hypothetical protein [Arthrobacter sp. SLBN-100]TQJ69118.1 hypothetical protein FBY31_3246 [Arthrobacter sp. SLBN-100]
MTTAIQNQFPAPMEKAAEAGAPVSSIRPADMGLLETFSSKMHCRTPMKRVDPDETPLFQPVHVDGATVIPVGAGSPLTVGSPSPADPLGASVETYRCACGFTIDVPAATAHALAS